MFTAASSPFLTFRGFKAMETLAPRDERETAEIVTTAISNGTPLEVTGSGSKRSLGRPVNAAVQLSGAAMSGVTLYEPSELVLRAGSGTPVREIVNRADGLRPSLRTGPDVRHSWRPFCDK